MTSEHHLLLGEPRVEFGLSSAQPDRALKGCTGGVGCFAFLLLASSIIVVFQGESWAVVALNLSLLSLSILFIVALLWYGRWLRQRVATARLTVFQNGFSQSRPSLGGTSAETCLWTEIRDVTRTSVLDKEVQSLTVVKNTGEKIRVSNQWLDFPILVGIIDSRGAIVDPRISDSEAVRIADRVDLQGVHSPAEGDDVS
jgi:hypothetical protein